MSSRPSTAVAIEAKPVTAADRLAMLLALPLREEPETDEECAILDEAQAALREQRRGQTTEEVLAAIDAMRDDAAAE